MGAILTDSASAGLESSLLVSRIGLISRHAADGSGGKDDPINEAGIKYYSDLVSDSFLRTKMVAKWADR